MLACIKTIYIVVARKSGVSFITVPKFSLYNFNLLFLCYSVTKSCPTLCDLMDCSMLAFPVLHYLPEFVQIHVH